MKRIVGLPGEAVEVKEGRVFVDGQPLEEPYLPLHIHTYSPNSGALAVRLLKDQYYVMGDNRPTSEDSRSYGPLSRSQIVGLLVK